jgi:predicted TIM-barrel fold metal-dependent hydrolase
VLNEFGLTWLPPVVWSLDAEYDLLRLESPWVKRYPSEYVHDHVRLSTQPLETTSDGRQLIEFLSTLDGIEDLICFSSDYPHYTMDDFAWASRIIPDAWHRKVFFDNARDLFAWSDVPTEAPVAASAAVDA